MRVLRNRFLALIALAVWTTPARPADDDEKMVPEEGAVQVMLLRQKSVREELKLTDDEARKIDDFTHRQHRKALQADKRDKAERERAYEQLRQENERFLDQTLEPQERKRLQEITLQMAGLLWVTNPDIASKLNLTDEQKQRAKLLQREARREAEELIHTHTGSARQEKFRELRETSRKRLMELLTDDQEVIWKQLTGAPFRGDLHYHDADKD